VDDDECPEEADGDAGAAGEGYGTSLVKEFLTIFDKHMLANLPRPSAGGCPSTGGSDPPSRLRP
jgi:hypothetical protein